MGKVGVDSRSLWSVRKMWGSQQRFLVNEDGEGKGYSKPRFVVSEYGEVKAWSAEVCGQ